jgi:hypothetical protein
LTPVADGNGSSTITVTVDDGTTTADDAFVQTVTAVNDAPIANNDTASVDANNSVVIDVVANDSDVEDGVSLLSIDSVTQ